MKPLYTHLLFTLPLLLEVALDYRRIVIKKKIDNHAQDVVIRAIMVFTAAFVNSWIFSVTFWQSALLAIAWFWLVFDYTINLLLKRPWHYLGETSWLDRRLRNLPGHALLFTKLWCWSVAIGIYYHLPKILRYVN